MYMCVCVLIYLLDVYFKIRLIFTYWLKGIEGEGGGKHIRCMMNWATEMERTRVTSGKYSKSHIMCLCRSHDRNIDMVFGSRYLLCMNPKDVTKNAIKARNLVK
jgi:hypothetical protein